GELLLEDREPIVHSTRVDEKAHEPVARGSAGSIFSPEPFEDRERVGVPSVALENRGAFEQDGRQLGSDAFRFGYGPLLGTEDTSARLEPSAQEDRGGLLRRELERAPHPLLAAREVGEARNIVLGKGERRGRATAFGGIDEGETPTVVVAFGGDSRLAPQALGQFEMSDRELRVESDGLLQRVGIGVLAFVVRVASAEESAEEVPRARIARILLDPRSKRRENRVLRIDAAGKRGALRVARARRGVLRAFHARVLERREVVLGRR